MPPWLRMNRFGMASVPCTSRQAPPALTSMMLQAVAGFSHQRISIRPWPTRKVECDDTVYAPAWWAYGDEAFFTEAS